MSVPKALIVNGSPRKNGNTSWVSTRVYETLMQKGIETTNISAAFLKSLNNGCIGCKGCQKSKEFLCVFKDDIQPLVASMPNYQYVIFATPVFFFGPSAQIKLVLDRMYSLMKIGENGTILHPFKGTKMGLIVTAGGPEEDGCDLTVKMFQRTADFFGRDFATLIATECFYAPEEYGEEEVNRLQAKATEFCDKLLGS